MMAAPIDAAQGGEREDFLVLRFEAPLLSFGGLAVDERRVTQQMPGRAMLTGLLANALGWQHGDSAALNRLQARLLYAVRREHPAEPLEDYQTVDLGQDFMHQGWTTHGRPEGRGGGSSKGTHIRLRHYLADAAYTVVLGLLEGDEPPDLDALEQALKHPKRPLFLGRKTCLPSRPLLGHRDENDRVQAASLLDALTRVPLWGRWTQSTNASRWQWRPQQPPLSCRVWWPGGFVAGEKPKDLPASVRCDRSLQVVDDRDWRQQFHAGRRFLFEGQLDLAEAGLIDRAPAPNETAEGGTHV